MIHRELYQVQEGKFKSITDVYQNISRILLDNELKEYFSFSFFLCYFF